MVTRQCCKCVLSCSIHTVLCREFCDKVSNESNASTKTKAKTQKNTLDRDVYLAHGIERSKKEEHQLARERMHVLCATRSIPAGARGVRPGRAAQAAFDVRTNVRNLGPLDKLGYFKTRYFRPSHEYSRANLQPTAAAPHFDENRYASRALEIQPVQTSVGVIG